MSEQPPTFRVVPDSHFQNTYMIVNQKGDRFNPGDSRPLTEYVCELLNADHGFPATAQAKLADAEARIATLEAALRFYADKETWEDHGYENGLHWVAKHAIYEDEGKVARAALTAEPDAGRVTLTPEAR